VFDYLAQIQSLDRFTLVGGTAIALQIGHRRSEDLDFWLPGNRMDKGIVSTVVRSAQESGFTATLATPHHPDEGFETVTIKSM
jgi:hypothetical protein